MQGLYQKSTLEARSHLKISWCLLYEIFRICFNMYDGITSCSRKGSNMKRKLIYSGTSCQLLQLICWNFNTVLNCWDFCPVWNLYLFIFWDFCPILELRCFGYYCKPCIVIVIICLQCILWVDLFIVIYDYFCANCRICCSLYSAF